MLYRTKSSPSALSEEGRRIVDWVSQELVEMMRYTALEHVSLVKMSVPPSRPRDGMVVYADGTNWNPGQGEGVYARVAGAWVKLH